MGASRLLIFLLIPGLFGRRWALPRSQGAVGGAIRRERKQISSFSLCWCCCWWCCCRWCYHPRRPCRYHCLYFRLLRCRCFSRYHCHCRCLCLYCRLRAGVKTGHRSLFPKILVDGRVHVDHPSEIFFRCYPGSAAPCTGLVLFRVHERAVLARGERPAPIPPVAMLFFGSSLPLGGARCFSSVFLTGPF